MEFDKLVDKLVEKLVVVLPPGWELRVDVKHLYLYYQGWVIARFSTADTPDSIAHGIGWHTRGLTASNDALATGN